MDEGHFRRLLHYIGSHITNQDLQNMKYLCSDEVEAGLLQEAESAIDLFNLLLNRDKISPSNLKLLEDILDKSGRKDLVGKVRTSGGDVASEGPLSAQEMSTSTPANKQLRYFLNQLCDELTKHDVDSMKFLIGVPAALAQKMKSGRDLMTYLQNKGMIGESDLGVLVENFSHIHRKDLANKVKKYSESQSVQTPVTPLTRLTISDIREPTALEHSEHTGAVPISPPVALMTPEHFTSKITGPAAPEIVRTGPRYPVQCGDDLPPPDQEDDMPAYPMRNRPRGCALIISNQEFTGNRDLKDRKGTEKDVENLVNLFTKLHFVVTVKINKSASEMYEVCRSFSSKDHSDFDCFICCLLSHGVHGSIYGTDSELLELSLITSQFKGNACRSLADKPKLFFIQACRGRDFDSGTQSDAVRDSEEDAMRHSAEPNEGHFLLGYATPPGYVSWRSTEHGSWYISKLCEVFSKYCEQYDVTSMMVKVNDEVSDAFTKKGYKQCPAPVVTLRKRIYLDNN